MATILKYFWFSITVTVVGLVSIFLFGGWQALFLTALLTLLEVTLSFDNAVVNARVLEKMTPVWQRRFLTWGIVVAVFGTRFLLPILIVSVVTWSSPWFVTQLAVLNPEAYGALLEGAKYAIHSFGAAFLLMVALKYFFDTEKAVHWIDVLEKRLSRWGHIEALEIVLTLLAVSVVSFFVPEKAQAVVMLGGVFGVTLFVVMHGITSAFALRGTEVAHASAAMFIYLEILDASFSLDGVIGAFALTSSIPIIAVGLGIGAFFVRSLTIYMVRQKTLDTLRYLEHGAHWAIFGLALSMLTSMLFHVPEIVTGSIGILFVVAAYYSSLKRR